MANEQMWSNLLGAIEYNQAAPDRKIKREAAMMQLQALKDANRKRTDLEAYRSGLDAPITPETTQNVPDTVASAQTDPNALYQEQPTKEVTAPATYLNDVQKLEKMERYMAMQGNFKEAKELNEYIKQTKTMGQHNPIVWQAWEASGGNEDKTKQILVAHGATPEQVADIDFSMAPMGALGSKSAGMYMTREGKTIHNKPKDETAPSFNQGGMTDKGYTVGFQPKLNQWMVNIDGNNVPYNEATHGKIRQAKEPIHITVPVNMQYVGSTPEGQPVLLNPRTGEFKPGEIPGGGRLQPKTEAPVAVDTAAKLQMMEQGQTDLKKAKELIINKDGKVNRAIIAQASAGVPFSKGRDLRSYILNAVEGKLRIESGAAVPDTEVKRIAVRFIPSVMDADDTVKQKLQRLEEYLGGSAKKLDPYGRINKNNNKVSPETQKFLDRRGK
jgi:hypothetical protein